MALREEDKNCYWLVVPMIGTVGQARDFAREIVSEFGCEVEIKETTPSGMVVRTISSETPNGGDE
jgi:hypothetical protein